MKLAGVEQEQARLVDLIMDPAISDIVKRSVDKRAADADADARRVALLASLDGLREQANENTEDIAEAARRIVQRARENLAAASTPGGVQSVRQ